jgi:hypothetical protein
MAAAATAYFISLPSLSTVFWTPAAFLIAAALAIVPALRMRTESIPPLLFGATGILLVGLPLLRAAVGGPGWRAALATGQSTVPAMDVLIALGGAACIVSAAMALRGRERSAIGVGSFAQPAE